jgi:hypothetical protein
VAQDLRSLFKKEREQQFRLQKGHELRFAKKLDQAMHHQRRRRPYTTFMIAASLLILVSIGTYTFLREIENTSIQTEVVATPSGETATPRLSLGDLSPDLRKIEQYYVANINLQLSDLEISSENKAMVDGYMERLAELNKDYELLNKELNTIGPNDQTINALINNLQLRLELLYKLKDKLETLKSSKNETVSSHSI